MVTIAVEMLEPPKTKSWWFFDRANHEEVRIFWEDGWRKTTTHFHSVQLVILPKAEDM